MNTTSSAPALKRVAALLATLVLGVSSAAGQVYVPDAVTWPESTTKENWVSFSAGSVSVKGNEAAFQRVHQHHRSGFGGVDAFRLKTAPSSDRLLTIDARFYASDNEYLFRMRYENTDSGSYLDAGVRESRVFYDGSGGYFPVNGQWFELYNPAMAVDRGEAWIEGALVKGPWRTRLRYSHRYREGMKDSTAWGDSNLTGLTGSTAARYIVPAFYDLDESTDSVVLDILHEGETARSGAGVRWENIKTDNSRYMRRRPNEAPDRYLTQREGTDSDLFSAHAYTEHRRSEKLILTSAASHTKIDTNFTGTRIFGANYDATFNPLLPTRQARDEGFYALAGDSHWKQLLLTTNALYMPAKHWRINAGLRYENQSQDSIADFIETAVGTTSALVTAQHTLASDSSRDFDELMGSVEATYTGTPNVVWTLFAEGSTGDGDLREELLEPDVPAVDIARDTTFDRTHTKFGANFRWYPATKLNFASGVYRRVRDNDYDITDDTTPNLTGGDRYPAYIEFQRFTTDDVYVRGTWRAGRSISLIARYDFQETDIDSREDGLPGVLSSEMTAHIMAGTVSWNPISRLAIQGTINYVYDQIVTPAATSSQLVVRQAGRFDNNYRTASLLVFYALDDQTDLQLDGALYQSGNYRDVSAVSVAYGLTARDRSLGATVNRRFSEDLMVGLRYAYFEYDDLTSGGNRDFTAHLVYGRVQLRY